MLQQLLKPELCKVLYMEEEMGSLGKTHMGGPSPQGRGREKAPLTLPWTLNGFLVGGSFLWFNSQILYEG